MQEHLISALFGLIGVLVGGSISFGIQFYFLRREENRRRRFALTCLMEKYGEILDDLTTLEKGISSRIPDNFDGELWRFVPTLIGEDKKPINFASEGLSLFYTKKNSELSMKIKSLASTRNTTYEVQKEYNNKRREIDELCKPHMTHIGRDLISRIEIEDIREHPDILMAISNAEALIQQIYMWVKQDLQKGKDLLPAFNQALKDVDGKNTPLKLELQD